MNDQETIDDIIATCCADWWAVRIDEKGEVRK